MKKKILFVINTLGHAGAEVAMLELFRHLDPSQYELSLYVLMGQGELAERLPKHIRLLNKSYQNVSVLSKEGRACMYRRILQASLTRGIILRRLPYLIVNFFGMLKTHRIWPDKLLWRILSDGGMRLEEHFDLAVAYLEGGSAYYVADHVKADKKAAFIHIDYGRAGYTRRLDRDCYLLYDRIFAVSAEVKEHFLEAYPECGERTEIFHNMINQEDIRQRSGELGGFEDQFDGIRILSVGRLTYQKSYHIAIQAMNLLRGEGYPVRWYVLGEGNLRPALEKQIAELGLQKDFLLLGAIPNPYPYYAQSDIYVHATLFEGKSIAIQEAQTLGCAIIASDCSGNQEQVEDGTDGILCKLTAEQMKESIVSLLEDPEKRIRLGKAAKAKKIVHEEDLQMLLTMIDQERGCP